MSCRRLLLATALLLPGMGQAQGGSVEENITYGYARVLRASPVYETHLVRSPEQRCDGRTIRNNGSAGSPCRSVEVERQQRRLAGYDVEYQYKGEKYMSRLPGDPGTRLRVKVSVSPDEPSLGYR